MLTAGCIGGTADKGLSGGIGLRVGAAEGEGLEASEGGDGVLRPVWYCCMCGGIAAGPAGTADGGLVLITGD